MAVYTDSMPWLAYPGPGDTDPPDVPEPEPISADDAVRMTLDVLTGRRKEAFGYQQGELAEFLFDDLLNQDLANISTTILIALLDPDSESAQFTRSLLREICRRRANDE
jgi:hypothetical protein